MLVFLQNFSNGFYLPEITIKKTGKFLIVFFTNGGKIVKGNAISTTGTCAMGQVIDFSSRRRSRLAPCVQDALNYLETHFAEPLSVDDLAQKLFISKYHLMREFKQATGQTVHAYLTDCRMQAAARMIRAGMPIQEIAGEVGYPDYSLFYKNFTRFAGISPREYQQQAAASGLRPCTQIHSGRELLQA